MLNPAARVLWRGERSVQLELGERAVVLDGVDTDAVRALTSRRAPRRAGALAANRAGVKRVLAALGEGGYIWPRGDDDGDPRLHPPLPRLQPELGAMSARYGEAAADMLEMRARRSVTIRGGGRTAVTIGAILGAAGVGAVHVADHGDVRLGQVMPGGMSPEDEGRRIAVAAATAVNRAAPETDTALPHPGQRPDLVVLAVDTPIEREQRDLLHQHGDVHLAVRLGADHGVVGPLVIPGLTSCLRCADLHRLERDPAWNAIAVQLTVQQQRATASNVALANVIAGVAALQALAYLDGAHPDAADATLELYLPDYRIRRRSWPLHPDCDCAT